MVDCALDGDWSRNKVTRRGLLCADLDIVMCLAYTTWKRKNENTHPITYEYKLSSQFLKNRTKKMDSIGFNPQLHMDGPVRIFVQHEDIFSDDSYNP